MSASSFSRQNLLPQQFGEQGSISRGGLEKALPLRGGEKKEVMNIALSRKKMHPPSRLHRRRVKRRVCTAIA